MGPVFIDIKYFQTKSKLGKVKVRLYFLKSTCFNVKITINYQIKASSGFIYASETQKKTSDICHLL